MKKEKNNKEVTMINQIIKYKWVRKIIARNIIVGICTLGDIAHIFARKHPKYNYKAYMVVKVYSDFMLR